MVFVTEGLDGPSPSPTFFRWSRRLPSRQRWGYNGLAQISLHVCAGLVRAFDGIMLSWGGALAKDVLGRGWSVVCSMTITFYAGSTILGALGHIV